MKGGARYGSNQNEQGMTQAVLAEKLGISDRAISKWETGKSMPDSGIMLELCELLKIAVQLKAVVSGGPDSFQCFPGL